MTRKSSTETLIAAMRVLARDIQSGGGLANAAIAEAADRLAEQQARIAELEQKGPVMQRGVNGDGTPLMGTMRQVLEDYKTGAATEAKLGDEARAECDQLRARVAELEHQAAIGRRAVAALYAIEWPTSRLTGSRYCPVCGHYEGHDERCELAAILRDAEQAGV